jgi:hypothetical protein
MTNILITKSEETRSILKALTLMLGNENSYLEENLKNLRKANVAQDNQKFIQQKMQGKRRTY